MSTMTPLPSLNVTSTVGDSGPVHSVRWRGGEFEYVPLPSAPDLIGYKWTVSFGLFPTGTLCEFARRENLPGAPGERYMRLTDKATGEVTHFRLASAGRIGEGRSPIQEELALRAAELDAAAAEAIRLRAVLDVAIAKHVAARGAFKQAILAARNDLTYRQIEALTGRSRARLSRINNEKSTAEDADED